MSRETDAISVRPEDERHFSSLVIYGLQIVAPLVVRI